MTSASPCSVLLLLWMRSSLACEAVGLLSAIRQGVDSDGSLQFVGDFRFRLRVYLQYSAVSVDGRELGYVAVDLRLHCAPAPLQPCKVQFYEATLMKGCNSIGDSIKTGFVFDRGSKRSAVSRMPT
jgi:hypothetical protein